MKKNIRKLLPLAFTSTCCGILFTAQPSQALDLQKLVDPLLKRGICGALGINTGECSPEQQNPWTNYPPSGNYPPYYPPATNYPPSGNYPPYYPPATNYPPSGNYPPYYPPATNYPSNPNLPQGTENNFNQPPVYQQPNYDPNQQL